MQTEIITPLGGKVRVVPAPEHLGPGSILVLTLVDPRDTRYAEIFLSPENKADLREMLTDE